MRAARASGVSMRVWLMRRRVPELSPTGRWYARRRRRCGHERGARIRNGLQPAGRRRAARLLHRARNLSGQLLRRARGQGQPALDVPADVPGRSRLSLEHGRGGRVADGRHRGVDVLLRGERGGAAERRSQDPLQRHERVRARGAPHRPLSRVLRHRRGAAAARLRAGVAGQGAATPAVTARLAFLDVLRGVALIVMVLNHTARWWIDRQMGWPRYWLVYGTVTVAARRFL